MRRYPVVVSVAADRDLDDITSYIAEHDSVDARSNRDFREIRFKPYRILYRVLSDKGIVVLIADGRRDMHALMTRRLLDA